MLSRQSLVRRRRQVAVPAVPPFTPSQVPQVAAGHWWDPELLVSNLGASNFSWGDGSGGAAWAQVQADPTQQPTAIVNNGHTQWRYYGTSDAAQGIVTGTASLTRTGNPVAAGWTGPTMISGWYRWPNNATSGTIIRHGLSTPDGRRIHVGQNANNLILGLSDDGTSLLTYLWTKCPTETLWHYYEWLFAPNIYPYERGLCYVDRVLMTWTQQPNVATNIWDTTTAHYEMCNLNAVPLFDTVDRGPQYYTNGIPIDGNRDLMMAYKAPV